MIHQGYESQDMSRDVILCAMRWYRDCLAPNLRVRFQGYAELTLDDFNLIL